MPAFKQVHADKDAKPNSEVVGSANLKDALKEHSVIRGTFYLNGHEYRDFEARSPGEVVRKINAGTRSVKASLDDEFRLVLENDGAEDIQIASGADGDRERQSRATAARDENLSDAQKKDVEKAKSAGPDKDAPDVLELLGLKANGDAPGQSGADWQPGLSADARKEQREKDEKAGKQPYRSVLGGRSPADDARIAERQGREGGGTTTLNQGPSDTGSPNPHEPTGAPSPYSPTPDHSDDGMGRSPPPGPQPGTTPLTTEQPSL